MALGFFVGITYGAGGIGIFNEPDIERKPLYLHSNVDFGQIVKGTKEEGGEISMDPIQRTSAVLVQELTINERLNFKLGVGGMFWYSYPMTNLPHQRGTKFGPGISVVRALYQFGDLDNPPVELEMGYFPVKYNPDAKNLGEYLFRSGTYPGYIYTGGWQIMNSAAYMGQGIRVGFNHFDGALKNNFTLFMEREWYPAFDFTPSWVGSLKLGEVLELGAGASFNHFLPLKPSLVEPKDQRNTYVQVVNGGSYVSYSDDTLSYMPGQQMLGSAIPKEVYNGEIREMSNPADSLRLTVLNRYSHQGIKLMGRAALDLKALFPSDLFAKDDMRLYAEVAVLGVKNYPYYYENIVERMPLMVGFNFPTFGLLDIFSVQMEHYRSKFEDNMYNFYLDALPIWSIPDSDPAKFVPVTKDDLKWSVYMKKSITAGLSLYGQFASDHFRYKTFEPRDSYLPVTQTPGEWYYLFRLEFAI